MPGNWRRGASETDLESRLAADDGRLKAVIVVHNETSTGVASRIGLLRSATNRVGHQALLIVDAVSSLGSIEFRQDEWQVDVAVVGSQKGLMPPPRPGIQRRVREGARRREDREAGKELLGLAAHPQPESGRLLPPTRRRRISCSDCAKRSGCWRKKACGTCSSATIDTPGRRAPRCGHGGSTSCTRTRGNTRSMTAFFMPDGHDADRFRSLVLEQFDMSLGSGLSRLAGRVVRIGHLGSFNDLTLSSNALRHRDGPARRGCAPP